MPEKETCPRDTNGDGDCGRRYCPICNPKRDNPIKEAYERIMKNRMQIMEEWAKAFVAETGLLPSQVELVEEIQVSKTIWRFRRIGEA